MTELFDAHFVIALCFIIFVYFSYRPIRKAILSALDSRILEIQMKLEETEKIKKDAKLLLNEMESEMQTFDDRKKHIIESARESTSQLIETKVKEMDLMVNRTKNSAIKSIENKRAKANAELSEAFTESVLKIVQNYLLETKNNSASDTEILKHFAKK